MRVFMGLATLLALGCVFNTVATQTPQNWHRAEATSQDFYHDKSECEALSQTYYAGSYRGGSYSVTDGRRWAECMAGRGWQYQPQQP